jgi:serine/threonine-protein kinase
MTITVGTRLGRYEIHSKIGAGGMGEVYLAQDAELDRKVALKILPTNVTANQDRMRRFVQEAKAAAKLNHPNIAHIYEIGEADGVNFIAMEFIDGQTLREVIHRGQTDLPKLLRYLQNTAEGLAKAHAAGIVHRDLKPDNVMITRDGHAKILDFGLAKLIEPQQTSIPSNDAVTEAATAILQAHSAPGVVLGTVGYMSPEQAQGKTNEIDHRSDIFSFGCILYEAVTGHKAFEGRDAIDSLNKIIREPVRPISDFRPEAPNHLQRIVRRCLAKDPDERYQTIKDIALELKELRRELAIELHTSVPPAISASKRSSDQHSTVDRAFSDTVSAQQPHVSSAEYILSEIKQHKNAAIVLSFVVLGIVAVVVWFFASSSRTGGQINSIAVMPFVNESGNVEIEYLSDGITESLINSLSQVPKISVKARSSVFTYKGKEVTPQQVAKDLAVQAILNGRVTQRGEQVTLNVELVDARTGNQVWGEQYNRRMTDLLSLQSEIARDVSSKLKLRLTGPEEQRIAKNYTQNMEAYQLYLRGRYHWNKRTGADLRKSIEYFQQAIDKDPSYGLAYAALAEGYILFPLYGGSPDEAFPKARAAALKAIEIDETLVEAHNALARIKSDYEWKFAEAEAEWQRSIALNPNYATAHQWYGEYLGRMGRYDEGLAELKRAQELDPLSLIINGVLGVAYSLNGQNDQAIEQLKKTLEMDPNFAQTHAFLAGTYESKGMFEEALDEHRKAFVLGGGSPDDRSRYSAVIKQAYRTSGPKGYWRTLAESITALSARNPGRVASPTVLAGCWVQAGETDKAFALLEKAYEGRDAHMLSLKDPRFDPIKSDPRYKDLLRRIGLPQN